MAGPQVNWEQVVAAQEGVEPMDPFYAVLDQLPEYGSVHYRWYLPRGASEPRLVCVQDFDYPDYIPERFLDSVAYLSEYEARA